MLTIHELTEVASVPVHEGPSGRIAYHVRVARCCCGWESDWRRSAEQARTDHALHVDAVALGECEVRRLAACPACGVLAGMRCLVLVESTSGRHLEATYETQDENHWNRQVAAVAALRSSAVPLAEGRDQVVLTIRHDDEGGTRLEGSSRGDGAAEVLRGMGWKWWRSVGVWGIPHSRERAPKLSAIDRAAEALRSAGHEVTVEIDGTPRDRAEAEAERADHMEARAERLEERAARHAAAEQAHMDGAHRILDIIPPGQPVLVGHHSERRHRRDLARVDRHYRAASEERREAERAAGAAQASARHMSRRENPITVQNRILRLEADIRRAERAMEPCPTSGRRMKSEAAGRVITCPTCYTDREVGPDLLYPAHGAATGRHREQCEMNLTAWRADLEHWRGVRAGQLASGQAAGWGPETVRVGDTVRSYNGWTECVRVNRTTVSVKTAYSWTCRVPYHEIGGVRRGGIDLPAPTAAAPAEQLDETGNVPTEQCEAPASSFYADLSPAAERSVCGACGCAIERDGERWRDEVGGAGSPLPVEHRHDPDHPAGDRPLQLALAGMPEPAAVRDTGLSAQLRLTV